jgi:hypothetical protein
LSNSFSLITSARESEHHKSFRALGVAVSKLVAPIVAKRGGAYLVRLKAEWAVIIGPDWAAVTWPVVLGRDGALKLRAASVAALELQHRAPLMIERINLFFGRSVVTRLLFVQGPLPLDSPPRAAALPAPPARDVEASIKQLSGIADPGLRAALARLGCAVIGSRT